MVPARGPAGRPPHARDRVPRRRAARRGRGIGLDARARVPEAGADPEDQPAPRGRVRAGGAVLRARGRDPEVIQDEGEVSLSSVTNPKGHHYDATSIQVLEGLEAVRKLPAMYIGATGTRGLHHLVYEVVDNSVDEALAGFCDDIEVTIEAEGSVTVADNGRGIPVDMHATMKKPALEVVMTTLHAGGKFDSKSYKVSGGLHGVGVSVVNALSEWCEVEVLKDGKIYRQRYEKGKPTGAMTSAPAPKDKRSTGTTTRFKPDAGIFEDTTFHWDTLAARLRELAFLNSGLAIDLTDANTNKTTTYIYKGGI